jgi:hypothetical protein
MDFAKLFALIPFAIILVLVSPYLQNYFTNYSGAVGPVIKVGMMIYYLRLSNNGTPLINTLTLFLVVAGAGEYLIIKNFDLGLTLMGAANIAFAITFLFRQKLKTLKDKNSKLKTATVFIYALSIILYLTLSIFPALIVGILALALVYFYDRVNQRQPF